MTTNKQFWGLRINPDHLERLKRVAKLDGEAAAVTARRGIMKEVRRLERLHAKAHRN